MNGLEVFTKNGKMPLLAFDHRGSFEKAMKAAYPDPQTLEETIKSMIIIPGSGEFVYDTTIQELQTLQTATTPTAANPEFQAEMNRIHALYQQIIPLAIQNIQAQYAAGTTFHSRIVAELTNTPLNLPVIAQLMQETQANLAPLQAEHKQNEAAMGLIAHRMKILTQENQPAATPSEQWAEIENCLKRN